MHRLTILIIHFFFFHLLHYLFSTIEFLLLFSLPSSTFHLALLRFFLTFHLLGHLTFYFQSYFLLCMFSSLSLLFSSLLFLPFFSNFYFSISSFFHFPLFYIPFFHFSLPIFFIFSFPQVLLESVVPLSGQNDPSDWIVSDIDDWLDGNEFWQQPSKSKKNTNM